MERPIQSLGGGWLHGMRVALLAKGISITFGFPMCMADEISFCAAFHDIGKLSIPANILEKPGRLTEEERAVIQKHPLQGFNMLPPQMLTDHPYLAVSTKYHHERWDGTGYPFGLQGYDIPLAAQVIGAADCVEALCSNRSYKNGFPPHDAINMVLEGKCGPFGGVVCRYLSTKDAREFMDIIFRTDGIQGLDRDLIRKVDRACEDYFSAV